MRPVASVRRLPVSREAIRNLLPSRDLVSQTRGTSTEQTQSPELQSLVALRAGLAECALEVLSLSAAFPGRPAVGCFHPRLAEDPSVPKRRCFTGQLTGKRETLLPFPRTIQRVHFFVF